MDLIPRGQMCLSLGVGSQSHTRYKAFTGATKVARGVQCLCTKRQRTVQTFATGGDAEGTSSSGKPLGGEVSNGNGDSEADGASQIAKSLGEGDSKGDGFTLDDINPYMIGRRSRALFDDVWTQFTRLSSPTQSVNYDKQFDGFSDLYGSVFEAPKASQTRVLVVGATGRVGRVLVRKLLLRGYKVRAMVRKREGLREATEDLLPKSVEVVYGDVGEWPDCTVTCQNVDKVIYCATARSSLTADLTRVDERGIINVAKALKDYQHKLAAGQVASAFLPGRLTRITRMYLANFPRDLDEDKWEVGFRYTDAYLKRFDTARARRKAEEMSDLTLESNDTGSLVFSGDAHYKGVIAECGCDVEPGYNHDWSNAVALVVACLGDGKQYSLVLTTADESEFYVRINSKRVDNFGMSYLRFPLYSFRHLSGPTTQLKPEDIKRVSFRYENRGPRGRVTLFDEDEDESKEGQFKFICSFVALMPGGEETDFVLVSCAGAPVSGETEQERNKRITFKRSGENRLRCSGLGYTIVRPGPLQQEPGGYKALVFDQGNRISQPISYADVADVCLKALHDPTAFNITFEVCNEYIPEEGLESYELVAHLPDKANNYLTPALATLQKNT